MSDSKLGSRILGRGEKFRAIAKYLRRYLCGRSKGTKKAKILRVPVRRGLTRYSASSTWPEDTSRARSKGPNLGRALCRWSSWRTLCIRASRSSSPSRSRTRPATKTYSSCGTTVAGLPGMPSTRLRVEAGSGMCRSRSPGRRVRLLVSLRTLMAATWDLCLPRKRSSRIGPRRCGLLFTAHLPCLTIRVCVCVPGDCEGERGS